MPELKQPQEAAETTTEQPLTTKKKRAMLEYMAIMFAAAFLLVAISLLIKVIDMKGEMEAANTGARENIALLQKDLDAARAERFTLYLLDVLMPGMTGMDAAREIRSFDAAADIIFLTTSPGFAYESYGVRAAEYLLKPINAKLLYPVLDKLYLREQKPQDGLTVKSNGMLVRLPFSQLSYVEVNGKHLFFNMADGTVYEVAASMREYEGALLARPEFMRVHRSYIVNMLQAEKLSPAGVITFSGHNVPVSRLLYGQLQKDYLALLFSGRDA